VRNPRRVGVPTKAMSPPFPITITLAGDSEFAMNSCRTCENTPPRTVVDEIGQPLGWLLSSIAPWVSECPRRPHQTTEGAQFQYHCTALCRNLGK